MKLHLFLCFLVLALMATAAENELFKNPRLEKNAVGWANWGSKMGLKLVSVQEGLHVTAIGPKLNQGPAQTLKLKPGYEYEYSCRIKGKLTENAQVEVLHWYFTQTKRSGCLRKLRGEFDWWEHKVKFTVPADCDGNTVLRPIIMTGPGEITMEWASLKEIGEKLSTKKEEGKIPEIVPVVHPKKVIDLSKEQPVNVRMHINEKVSQPVQGCSVENQDGTFVINYKFMTLGHDAVMFDIAKELDSCKKVSMEITSNGKGHRLFFVLTDKSGEAHLTNKPIMLTFQGSKKIDMVIPLPPEKPYDILDSNWGGDENQHLDLPLKSLTIVLDDCPDASTDAGVISIKDLKVGNW